MLKAVTSIVGMMGGGSLISYGILAAGVAGYSTLVYNHGKTVMEGKMSGRFEKLIDDKTKVANNFVQILINEKREHYEDIQRLSDRSQEMVTATETFFNASQAAREAAQRDLQEYRAELRAVEEENDLFKQKLKEKENAWLEQNTPFDLVCDIYSGVLDIDDCSRLEDTRTDSSN